MNILIIGSGYVGLVTGTCFAEIGHTVTCLDIDTQKIESLKCGTIPFYEPGLKELVLKNYREGRLIFTNCYKSSVGSSDVIFLAVPTPSRDDGSCDLSYFLQATKTLAAYLQDYTVIVNKSTVPVGTAQMVENLAREIVKEDYSLVEFDVVSNPEFLKEGSAVSDCMSPDRIILGLSSKRAESCLRELYSPITDKGCPLYVMDAASSEMTKYAANAMLATRISFMNELSGLCEKLGANIHKVKVGIGSDKRIGTSFLNAGIGYGGSCFPKDIKALRATAEENGISMPILQAIETVNKSQKKILVSMMREYFKDKGGLEGKTIAVWGLSFKPETDDMREAPSLDIIAELQEEGALLRAYDPISLDSAKKALKNHEGITFCSDVYDTCKEAHAIALITEWAEFAVINLDHVSKKMNGRAFFDGRNVFNKEQMRAKGFHHFGIGIPNHASPLEANTLVLNPTTG
ncbi:MAG: UDP-glucose/GDP-mannose dehydrogenase family protein [Chlamydiae bacterium]|nr:UDP-glucose/GDP-mannose dehydrogenase family protein [Chlamydiota bacterium]